MLHSCKYISILFILGCLLAACSSSRNAVSSGGSASNAGNDIIKRVAESYSDWSTFSTSGKINISMQGGQSISSSMQIKMVHDKYIFISLRPILGIEVARVYISNDSIILVDKYHKAYMAENIHTFVPALPADISSVQDVFLNRVFSLKDGSLKRANTKEFNASAVGQSFQITPKRQTIPVDFNFTVNDLLQLTKIEVSAENSPTKYSITYSDFAKAFNAQMASDLSMSTTISGKNVNINLQYNSSRNKWNASFNDDLSINDGYRRITAKEFVSLLKQL